MTSLHVISNIIEKAIAEGDYLIFQAEMEKLRHLAQSKNEKATQIYINFYKQLSPAYHQILGPNAAYDDVIIAQGQINQTLFKRHCCCK